MFFRHWCDGSLKVQVWQITFVCEQAEIGSVDLDLFVLLGLVLCGDERKSNEQGSKII